MSNQNITDPTIVSMVNFLREIGLTVQFRTVTEPAFVPGIILAPGGLVIDLAQLSYPGDILHEAGHLAVMPPARRQAVHLDAGKYVAEEMGAIAWSYAAAVHLNIDINVLFHPAYKGNGQYLVDNFSAGYYIGLPILVWLGLTRQPQPAATEPATGYPKMLNWLLDHEPN